jgi:hypothetical protein
MIRRLLLCCLAAAPLPAQLALSVLRDSTELPAGSQVQLVSTAVSDTLDTLFRVRNTGKAIAPVTALSIAGTCFSVTNLPILPAVLLPGAYVDFTVRFQPITAASYSALLKTDGVSVFVLASGLPVLTAYVEENGTRRLLNPASPLDFGAVERGTQAVRRLLLVNESVQPLKAALGIAGNVFQLAPDAVATLALDPQKSAYVDVLFAPVEPGTQQGELRIDQRRFLLRGSTLEPPLPKPIITLDFHGAPPASGMQPLAAVRFDPVPRTSGTGKLRIDFHPSVDAADDPAILFITTSSRSIDFSVLEGEANAQFGPAAAIPLQTGTTAGTIVLTAQVGDDTETARVEIPPQSVVIDSVRMIRPAAGIEVQVSGYDNTRTLSRASFTFLQKDGTFVPPGAMPQDLAALLKDYFVNSGLGGSFQIKAAFPVTGSPDSIDSVKISLANSAGTTTWPAP